MKIMANLLCLFMCICFLSNTLTGCNQRINQNNTNDTSIETEPIRILIDVDFGSNIRSPQVKQSLEKYIETDEGYDSLKKTICDLGGPSEIILEYPPISGDERDAYLTSLRTEILAGKGPDVFICMTGPAYVMDLSQMIDGAVSGNWVDPVFGFPQQAMKHNLFLCLDEYIPKFRYTDWDSLTPVVMKAGKYNQKQYLLPLSFTLPVTLFKKTDVQHDYSKDLTWYDMANAGPELRAASALDSSIYFGNALMPLANTSKDELAFTEEELYSFITKKIDLEREAISDKGLPDYSEKYLSVGFTDTLDKKTFPGDEPLTMVPLYSAKGGYGATITSFAAVNANTSSPDDAAFIIDYILSEECQRSILYSYITYGRSVPTLEGLMQQENGVFDGSSSWNIPANVYDEFCDLRDNIAWAEFETILNVELQKLYKDILDNKNASVETLVHDAYMRMSMEMAES